MTAIAQNRSNQTALREMFEKLFLINLDQVSLKHLVETARKGVKTSYFYMFANAIDMPDKELAEIINISPRTLSNYKSQHKTLEPVRGEHLLKLITLFEKGEEIFGSINEFTLWLRKPAWHSNSQPIEWLITPGGVDLVSDELDRIAHGYAL